MELKAEEIDHITGPSTFVVDDLPPTKPAIVLDLDETIVNCSMIKAVDCSFSVKVGNHRRAYISSRPGLHEFLKEVSIMFDIFFFTASSKIYANQIIDTILPDTPSDHRFFCTSCRNIYGYSVKDLSLIGRPMSQILLVDDIIGSAILQPENLIRITPWDGDQNDSVLLDQLLPILVRVKEEGNLPLATRKILDQNSSLFKNLFSFR